MKVSAALLSNPTEAQKYFDLAGVCIVALDTKGIVICINLTACRILKYSREELIGKNWFDTVVPKNNQQEMKEAFVKMMCGEVVYFEEHENNVLTKTSDERIVHWSNSIVVNESGGIEGTISSGIDVTDRKNNDIFLEKHTKELERINKLMVGRELTLIALKVKLKKAGISLEEE